MEEGRPWEDFWISLPVDVFVYYFLASLVCAGKLVSCLSYASTKYSFFICGKITFLSLQNLGQFLIRPLMF